MSGADPGSEVSVTFAVDGGVAFFPGLSAPFHVGTAELGADDAARLRSLVDQADVFGRPDVDGEPAPGAADVRTYTVSVTSGGRTRTLRAVEPIADDALRGLVEQLAEWQRRARAG